MSMAARAMSSRAVSSISLAGIVFGIYVEGAHTPDFLSTRLAAALAPGSLAASHLERRPSPLRGEGESRSAPSQLPLGRGRSDHGLALALALVASELVFDG